MNSSTIDYFNVDYTILFLWSYLMSYTFMEYKIDLVFYSPFIVLPPEAEDYSSNVYIFETPFFIQPRL